MSCMMLLPMVLSLVGAIFYLTGEASILWRLAVLLMAIGAAVVLLLVPAVPYAVPVLLQIGLSLGFVIYWQIDNLRLS